MKLRERIKRFFLPPEGTPMWLRLMPYAVLGVLTIILLTGSAYTWEYTNSPAFCGTSCHTMPPEYSSYQVSPHARVACVDCHIGKGFISTRITRKAGDLKHVTATLFKNYEFPIRARELRPARETCEQCHFPEKFSDDSLREIERFTSDAQNTPYSIYMTLKTGGGSQRQGLGRGIHWHIENQIQYLESDAEGQKIPYVRMVNPDGSVEQFVDVESDVNVENIDPSQLRDMDCTTCHNRITHKVQSPEDAIDKMMAQGVISPKIPEIRKKALEVYTQVFDTTEKGLKSLAGLEEYYRVYHPDFYSTNKLLIQEAIKALQDSYAASVYPEQNSDWSTHPNNVGHKNSPGCFRCHDGKHMNAEREAIRLECNLCHSVPVVAGPDKFVAELEISRGPEPETHKNTNWIAMHNQAYNETCTNCHTTGDAGGTSDTSFCSNSACHGNVWTYAGFDAPKLRETIKSILPPTPTPAPLPTGGALTFEATIGPLLQSRCGSCHGEGGMMGLNLTTYAGVLTGGKDGPAVVPGDVQGSLLIQKQTAAQPHFYQLSGEELQLITDWILAGSPEK